MNLTFRQDLRNNLKSNITGSIVFKEVFTGLKIVNESLKKIPHKKKKTPHFLPASASSEQFPTNANIG